MESSYNNYQIINPFNYKDWNKRIQKFADYSFFHSLEWAALLKEVYDYYPKYVVSESDDELNFILPLFEVNSRITGKRGISLPFSDFCVPLSLEGKIPSPLITYLEELGRKNKWTYYELRGGNINFPHINPSQVYLSHIIQLVSSEDKVFSNFRSSTKRNIQKALRSGVKISFHHTFESIEQFYRLNCITRKKHGLPPQPYLFFRRFYDHIISNNNGFVILAHYESMTIAGAIFLHIGIKGLFKYGASDPVYQNLRANNLIFWEAIRWFIKNGYNEINLGKTLPEHTGLRQFKNGWGALEKPIHYYKFHFKKKRFVRNKEREIGFYNKIFHNLPIPILRLIGNKLYRHIG